MTAAPAPLGLAQTFALIIEGVRRAAASHMAVNLVANRAAIPLLMLACRRLARMVARFAALAARVQAGKLPPPRRRPARPAPRPARPRTPEALPRSFAWLVRLVRGTACGGSQLQHLLSQPEMISLIEAAPQAGRIFRPLCRMLAVPLPASLQLPRRPARPKPARPEPASAEPTQAAPPSAEPPPFRPTRAGPLRRRPRGPAPPGTVWRRWRGIWMPEPVRPEMPG